MTQPLIHFFCVVSLLAWGAGSVTQSAFAKQPLPVPLEGVGIQEKLGESLRTPEIDALRFKNSHGDEVALSSYFDGKRPVILSLIYYSCPSLCNFVLNAVLQSVRGMDWLVGREFQMVTLSIDPREKPPLAKEKKASYLKNYGRVGAESGWHFLTGEEKALRKVSDAVGFGYRFDKETQEYAHGAAIFVLTPEGIISRYLYGIEYPRRDLKLALLEASSGKVGSVMDRVLLFCYRYDPESRGYSLFARNLMKAGGAGTVLVLGGYLFAFWVRERRKLRRRGRQDE